MTRLTLTSGLSAASVPPLPADAAQIGCGDWSVDGLLVGCAFIQSYIDYVFEGEFSSTSVEWVDLKQLEIPTSTECGGDASDEPLGTLKPIQLEEECSPLGRKSFLFAVQSEQKPHAKLCASLLARGHSHALATVARYERCRPPLPDLVDEDELKDVSLRWSWTTKMRQSIQRICRQMDDDEDHYVVCSESMASKSGASLPAADAAAAAVDIKDFCPMISVRRVSMIDVEDVKSEARVWLESVAVDAKKTDDDDDPFGTRESASFAVRVDAKDIRQKEIKGKIDEIAHQVFVVLSCFT